MVVWDGWDEGGGVMFMHVARRHVDATCMVGWGGAGFLLKFHWEFDDLRRVRT